MTDFEHFVQEHWAALVRLAHGLCDSKVAAEDSAQDALVSVYKKWSRIEHDPLPYARRAVINATRSSWRRERVRRRLSSHAEPGYSSDLALDVDSMSSFESLVRLLPRGQRAVLVLRFGVDLSVADTARSLGISEGSVKSQTNKALKSLRQTIGPTSARPTGGFDA